MYRRFYFKSAPTLKYDCQNATSTSVIYKKESVPLALTNLTRNFLIILVLEHHRCSLLHQKKILAIHKVQHKHVCLE